MIQVLSPENTIVNRTYGILLHFLILNKNPHLNLKKPCDSNGIIQNKLRYYLILGMRKKNMGSVMQLSIYFFLILHQNKDLENP